MSIRARIFAVFIVVLALGVAGLTRWVQSDMRPRYLEAQEDPLVEFANVMAALVAAHGLVQGSDGWQPDPEFLRAALPAALERPLNAQIYAELKQRVDVRVYLTDARGVVLYDSDSGRDEGADYSQWRDVYRTLRGDYGARGTEGDPIFPTGSTMFVAAPVLHQGDVVGVISVGKPTRMAERFLDDALLELTLGGVVAVLVAVAAGALIYAWVSRPLDTVQRYVQAVERGERVRAPDLGDNEIGRVARAVESMRRALDGKAYVEEYVQALTHELKSPTTAIRGAAELLVEDMPEADRQRFVANIRAEAGRLQDILERLLELAAIEARRGLEAPERVGVTELVRAAVEATESAARARNVTVEVGVEVVDRDGADTQVSGDRFLLQQALVNLIGNAVEFSPEGARVQVRVTTVGDGVSVTVEDSGPGVPDYALGRVFERFYGLPRPDGARGSGLGLAFVREITNLHGGRVQLANRTGSGAAGALASLWLPRAGAVVTSDT